MLLEACLGEMVHRCRVLLRDGSRAIRGDAANQEARTLAAGRFGAFRQIGDSPVTTPLQVKV